MKTNRDNAGAHTGNDAFERDRAEKMLSDLIQNNPFSIQIVDRNGFTLKVNPAHTALFGSVPPPDFSIFDDLQRKSKEFAKLVCLVKRGEIVKFPDIYYNTHDIDPALPDVPLWIRGVVFPIRGSNNKPERFVLMHENITEQVKYQDVLRASEDKFRGMFDQSPVGMAIVGLDKCFIKCNDAMCSLFGYTEHELVGKPITHIASSQDVALGIAQMEQMLKREIETFSVEKRYLAKNGDLVWCLNSYRLLFDAHQKPAYFIAVIQDITRRIKMEKEKEKLEGQLIVAQKLDSLGVLAGGLAHDFNNMLTGIISNISLAIEEVNSAEELNELLKEAKSAAFRAKDLTKQLLTFARGGTPVKKPAILSGLIKESAVFAARGTNSKCTFCLADDLRIVEIDAGQIGQVISNIVINAARAMPGGGDIAITAENITIDNSSKVVLKPGDYVGIKIKDSGRGIPSEQLGKIFDPYFTTGNSGSGLGLSISYSIVKMHNGVITVESEPGKGSVFTVYLPACTHSADIPGNEREPALKRGSGRILVMDDDKAIRLSLNKFLKKIGYSVEIVSDGFEAVSCYTKKMGTKEAFDAVILDLMIQGGKGGVETIRELKQLNPAIKAIVSSGYSDDPVLSDHAKYGFSAILPKPYNIHELSEILHSLLLPCEIRRKEVQ